MTDAVCSLSDERGRVGDTRRCSAVPSGEIGYHDFSDQTRSGFKIKQFKKYNLFYLFLMQFPEFAYDD